MTVLTTKDAWEFARAHLCHLCNGTAEDTCEGCGQRVCLSCSEPDGQDVIRFCRECMDDAS